MRVRRPVFIFLCFLSITFTACEDADEPQEVTAEDVSETAITAEKETFQRRAQAYLDEMSNAIDSLAGVQRVPDTLVHALEERVHHLREEVSEVEDMTAVVFRDRHDELQEQLYQVEGAVVAARLAAAPTRSAFVRAARRHMAERERAISEFARASAPDDRDPQTPHASDLGRLRANQKRIVTLLERLEAGELQFSRDIQRDIADEIGELTTNLRLARDLVQYPEMKEQEVQ